MWLFKMCCPCRFHVITREPYHLGFLMAKELRDSCGCLTPYSLGCGGQKAWPQQILLFRNNLVSCMWGLRYTECNLWENSSGRTQFTQFPVLEAWPGMTFSSHWSTESWGCWAPHKCCSAFCRLRLIIVRWQEIDNLVLTSLLLYLSFCL